MAGDWLKVCKETPDKPEILAIAARLNCHPDVAFARCFKLWSWFDSHTTDGVTCSVTKVTLDALLNRDGLCDALVTVSWLIENEDGTLQLPNFGYHNGETAKTRAMAAKRQDRHRNNSDKSNAGSVTKVTQSASLREEKRREENKETLSSGDDESLFNPTKKPKAPPIPYDEIFDLYNEIVADPFGRPAVKIRNDKRKRLIKKVWDIGTHTKGLDWWRSYFERTTKNEAWMNGRQHKDGYWDGANFDFLLREDNFLKVVE